MSEDIKKLAADAVKASAALATKAKKMPEMAALAEEAAGTVRPLSGFLKDFAAATKDADSAAALAEVMKISEIMATLTEKADAIAEDVAAAAKAAKKPKGYVIAEGCALQESGRGVMGPGDPIKASDMAGGEKAFKHFLKTGHIVKEK